MASRCYTAGALPPLPLSPPAPAPTPAATPHPLGGYRLAAAAITLLAFALRLCNLSGQSLWFDEAFSLLLAQRDFGGIVETTARDTMPPLGYWLLHAWGASGPSVDWYPRMLSVLLGTLALPLLWAVARPLVGPRPALLALLLAAIAPFQVFYAQEVRMYALLSVTTLLAIWGVVLAWWQRQPAGWAVFALGAAASVYTHAMGALPVAGLLLWLALAGWRTPRRLLPAFVAAAVAGVAYLPWAGALAQQAARVLGSFWVAAPSPLALLVSPLTLYLGPFGGPLVFAPALAALLLALGFTLTRGPQPPGGRAALGLLWAWLGLPLLLLFALSQLQPIYLERVVIGAGFGGFVLAAWGALRLPHPAARAALALALLLPGAWGLRTWLADPNAAKPPYRDALAAAVALGPGLPVVHTSDGSYLPFTVYAPTLPQHLLAGDPEAAARTARARSTIDTLGIHPEPLEQALGAAAGFVLVVSYDHSADWQRQALADIDTRYRLAEERSVGGILVRRYQRP